MGPASSPSPHLTDVEQEHNGLYFYDRRPKFDLKRLHASTARRAAFEKVGLTAGAPVCAVAKPSRVFVGARADGALARPYLYTLTAPGANWTSETFEAQSWQTGQASFDNANVRTPWDTSDIWLRQNFEANDTAIHMANIP